MDLWCDLVIGIVLGLLQIYLGWWTQIAFLLQLRPEWFRILWIPFAIGAFCFFLAQFFIPFWKLRISPRIWMNLSGKSCKWVVFFQVLKRLFINIASCQKYEAIGVVQFFSWFASLRCGVCHPCELLPATHLKNFVFGGTDPAQLNINNAADSRGNFLGLWISFPVYALFHPISPVGSKSTGS